MENRTPDFKGKSSVSSLGVLKHQADTMLRRATAAGDIPGVAAMACSRDAMLYEGAFGTRRLGVNKPMAIDSVVWIASMTKPITSAGVMQLVEQGRIGLDDAAGRWVPELASVQVLEGFDGAGSPRLRPPKRPITLRHLLTHTSGHTYDIWNAAIGEYRMKWDTPSLASDSSAVSSALAAASR